VPVLNSSLTVWGSEDDYWNNWPCFRLYFGEFSYEMASFDIAPGVPTGVNRATLNPVGSPPVGEYTFHFGDSYWGQFEMRLEGMLTNDLYNSSVPILFFASIFGGVPGGGGGGGCPNEYFIAGAPVAADIPMIVPLIGNKVERDLPKVMGAHVLEWDADTNRLRLLENTTLAPDADIAMVRYSDGSYTVDPAVDESLGAHVVVEPLSFTSESPEGVFNFADAAIRIAEKKAFIAYYNEYEEPVYDYNYIDMLTGFLRNPVLNGNTGGFFADLEITEVSGSSPVLEQIYNSNGKKMMQIAVGAAAYDLVKLIELTEGRSGVVYGRMPWPELFHIGVVRDCDPGLIIADFDNDGFVNYKDFANLAQYWLQAESLIDIAPFPDGDRIVDTQDLAALIRSWLGRCE
jgi:hypothetical protein